MLWQIELQVRLLGRGRLALLMDTSASMSLGDEYEKSKLQRLRALTGASLPESRFELVLSSISDNERLWLRNLTSRYQVELYELRDHLIAPEMTAESQKLPTEVEETEVNNLIDQLRAMRAEGSATDFHQSLQEFEKLHSKSPAVAAVLVTDGNSTVGQGGLLSEAVPEQGGRKIPLFVVGVGSERSQVNVSIQDVRHDAVAFAGSELLIDISFASDHADGKRLRAQIRTVPEQVVLDSKSVRLGGDSDITPLTLTVPELEPGWNEFEVEIDALPGESAQQDNRKRIRAWGHDAQLRVLLVERIPRWEFHHLKKRLERDPNFELQTILLDSDLEFQSEDKTALDRVPVTLAELREFDAVVLGDVDLQSVDPRFASLLPDFVSQDGGGLMLISGRKYCPVTYLGSALNPLVPVRQIELAAQPESRRRKPVFVAAEGRGHPLLTMQRNEPAWLQDDGVPEVAQPFEKVRVRRGARTLLEVPSQHASGNDPLVVSMRFGAGQVLLHLTDELWLWRSAQDGKLARRYWSQAVRYLTKQRILRERPPGELLIEQTRLTVGETAELRLHRNAPDQGAVPLPSVVVESDEVSMTIEMQPLELGVLQAQVSDLKPGTYRARLAGSVSLEESRGVEWTVVDRDRERTYAPLNRDDLQLAASNSGGAYYELWELDKLLNDLPAMGSGRETQVHAVPLWNRVELICLLVVCLAIDWILTRRLR